MMPYKRGLASFAEYRRTKQEEGMNVLVVLSSADTEIRWNAIRFCNVMLNAEDEVSLFLNGPAAALYEGDSERFPLRAQAKLFSLSGGVLAA